MKKEDDTETNSQYQYNKNKRKEEKIYLQENEKDIKDKYYSTIGNDIDSLF